MPEQPYAFTIYRKSHDVPASTPQTRWYADTEYGLVPTLIAVMDLASTLKDASTISSITIMRVAPKK